MKAGKSSKKAKITYDKLEERKSDNFLPKTSTFFFFSSYTGHDLRGLTHHNAAIKHVPFFFYWKRWPAPRKNVTRRK